jgi:hypothetical protein
MFDTNNAIWWGEMQNIYVNELYLAFFLGTWDFLEKQNPGNENSVFILLYKQC